MGLSYFDLHVQTDDLSPLWQRTYDGLRICIGRNNYQTANQIVAQYQVANAATPSPLSPIYSILFKCMVALCQLSVPNTSLLSADEQATVINFFKDTQVWQMLEFSLFQYTQWFLEPQNAARIFRACANTVTTVQLKDAKYLYRLAFFDAAIAHAQCGLLKQRNIDFALRRLQETRLLFHTNTERQINLKLIELVRDEQAGLLSKAGELQQLIDVIHELGLNCQYTRINWWATNALKGVD